MGILKLDVTDFSDLIHHLLIYVSKLYVLNRISLNSYHVSDYYFWKKSDFSPVMPL